MKKKNERGGSEGLDFLFFISVQGSAEREYCNRRGRFPFFVKLGESTERVRLVLRVCFHLKRERLGCRGPPWSFFSLIYIYVSLFAHLMDFVNERCV